jgi:hypothetical protein
MRTFPLSSCFKSSVYFRVRELINFCFVLEVVVCFSRCISSLTTQKTESSHLNQAGMPSMPLMQHSAPVHGKGKKEREPLKDTMVA